MPNLLIIIVPIVILGVSAIVIALQCNRQESRHTPPRRDKPWNDPPPLPRKKGKKKNSSKDKVSDDEDNSSDNGYDTFDESVKEPNTRTTKSAQQNKRKEKCIPKKEQQPSIVINNYYSCHWVSDLTRRCSRGIPSNTPEPRSYSTNSNEYSDGDCLNVFNESSSSLENLSCDTASVDGE